MKNCCCLVYDLKTPITANQSHWAARPANILKLLTRQICAWDSWTVCNLLSHSSSFPLIEVDRYFLVLHIVFKSHLTDLSRLWWLTTQDFSHDGQAPDVFFWADGVIVPYITRYTQLCTSRISHQPCLGMTWRQRLDLRGSCQERTLWVLWWSTFYTKANDKKLS